MSHDTTTETHPLTDTDPSIDLIRTRIPDDQPDWTENIAWSMHDPKSGISIYGHLGRMQPDRSIWEGLSLIFLPEDGMLVNRSLGVSLAEARNGEYHYKPIVPTKLWRFGFDGVAQRAEPEALSRRPLGDEPFEAVSYDLVFEALQPVFNMHKSDRHSERMHLEQGGRMHGVVVAAGHRYVIDCTAYRDHSVSRRTFTTLDTETWTHCAFPSGRIFSLLEVKRGGRHLLEAQVYRDGKMQLAVPQAVPELTNVSGSPHRGVIELQTDSGRCDIHWETRNGRYVPFQLLRPVGMRPGVDAADSDNIIAVQCPTQFVWEGEVGYGWMERSRPLKGLLARRAAL